MQRLAVTTQKGIPLCVQCRHSLPVLHSLQTVRTGAKLRSLALSVVEIWVRAAIKLKLVSIPALLWDMLPCGM